MTSLKNPKLILNLFITTLIIQITTNSITPILTLYIHELTNNINNITFINNIIASIPNITTLLNTPRLDKLNDRIKPKKILITTLIFSILLLIPISYIQTPLQLKILHFLLDTTDNTLLPTIQTLLIYNSNNQIAKHIFNYNQSFHDIDNITKPLIKTTISTNYNFKTIFLVTTNIILFNTIYS